MQRQVSLRWKAWSMKLTCRVSTKLNSSKPQILLDSIQGRMNSVEETSEHGVLGRHQTCSKERNEVLSNTVERHTLPAYCIPERCPDGNCRNHIRKSIGITSTASEDFLERSLDEGIGFRSCSTSRRQTQPNPNPIYRTGRPVVTEQTSRSSAQEIDTRFSLD